MKEDVDLDNVIYKVVAVVALLSSLATLLIVTWAIKIVEGKEIFAHNAEIVRDGKVSEALKDIQKTLEQAHSTKKEE